MMTAAQDPVKMGQDMFYFLEIERDYAKALEIYRNATDKATVCGVPTLDVLNDMYVHLRLEGEDALAKEFYRHTFQGRGLTAETHDAFRGVQDQRVHSEIQKRQAEKN